MLKVKLIKIAVVVLCIPAAKVTSRIILKKIEGDDYYKEPTDEEWRKIRKQGHRSLFLSTLAFYMSIGVLILQQLLKIIP